MMTVATLWSMLNFIQADPAVSMNVVLAGLCTAITGLAGFASYVFKHTLDDQKEKTRALIAQQDDLRKLIGVMGEHNILVHSKLDQIVQQTRRQ